MNTDKQEYSIFTDGSVNQSTKTGAGCYLILRADELSVLSLNDITAKIAHSYFSNTSSTKLEIQILLSTFEHISTHDFPDNLILNFYTDSQNIITLPSRREKLMHRDFKTGNGERELRNAELYKKFFNYLDRYDCRFIQVEGHKKKNQKNNIDAIFTLVDRESRRLTRNFNII